MNKTQNTLIIITFLIAVFFMGQWLWDNVPRYKTQERIEFCNGASKECLNEDCSNYSSYSCGYWARYKLENVVLCQRDEGENEYNIACYIKEKIRTN